MHFAPFVAIPVPYLFQLPSSFTSSFFSLLLFHSLCHFTSSLGFLLNLSPSSSFHLSRILSLKLCHSVPVHNLICHYSLPRSFVGRFITSVIVLPLVLPLSFTSSLPSLLCVIDWLVAFLYSSLRRFLFLSFLLCGKLPLISSYLI